DSLAVSVDDDHVFRLDETLVADRRSAHDLAIGKARADVAIRRSNVTFLINEIAETLDLRADFGFRHGRILSQQVAPSEPVEKVTDHAGKQPQAKSQPRDPRQA